MATDERSDEELLREFLDGDQGAFAALVGRHEDRIFGLALRMTGDRSDAFDATQDAFVAAFRQAKSFRGDAAFGTWLYRVAINACRDLLRKRGRMSDQEAPEIADSGRMEERVVARIDVARALAQIPAEYREAVAMHDLGGIRYEEIAGLTGVSIGTVKSRISRGRRRLGELLEQSGESARQNEDE